MDVPLNVPDSNKNRTKMSYDDGFIQKIQKIAKATRAPSTRRMNTTTTRAPTTKRMNETTTRATYTDNRLYDAYLESINDDVQRLLNSSGIGDELRRTLFEDAGAVGGKLNRKSMANLDTWLHHYEEEPVQWTLPPLPKPKIKFEFEQNTSPATTIWIAFSWVLFSVFVILRLCLYRERCKNADYNEQRRLSLEQQLAARRQTDAEQQSSDNESVTLSVTSDEGSSNQADNPPSYTDCAPNSHGIVNKTLDLASEEPPPYSSYFEKINNKEENPKLQMITVADGESQSQVTNIDHTNLTDNSQLPNSFLRTNINDRIGDTVINMNENISQVTRTTGTNDNVRL